MQILVHFDKWKNKKVILSKKTPKDGAADMRRICFAYASCSLDFLLSPPGPGGRIFDAYASLTKNDVKRRWAIWGQYASHMRPSEKRCQKTGHYGGRICEAYAAGWWWKVGHAYATHMHVGPARPMAQFFAQDTHMRRICESWCIWGARILGGFVL